MNLNGGYQTVSLIDVLREGISRGLIVERFALRDETARMILVPVVGFLFGIVALSAVTVVRRFACG